MGGGMNELADVLNRRMREAGRNDIVADFGTIGKNGFLTTDIMQKALRRDSYMILAHVGELKDGDRVLVVWVYPEPVIVGKVV